MTRMILLAGCMAVAAPAFAQTGAPAGQAGATAPQSTTAPSTTMPQSGMSQPAPVQDPMTAQSTGASSTGTAPAATAQSAPQAPAATPGQSQIAQVVDQQFGTYDKDASGSLSKAEFASWMGDLKSAANATEADPAKETAWNDAAFTQADGDKSTSVSKTELTSFLVKGSTGAS